MASHRSFILLLQLLLISSLLCVRSKAQETGSVFFIDSATYKYLRTQSSDIVVESNTISPFEVGAAVSILLGLPPPFTLPAASSSKLNEVLTPNPFDRPRAAFVVEVRGVQDAHRLFESDLLNGGQRKVVFSSEKADIQLSDEEVSVVSVDESVSLDSDWFTDKDIHNFASLMGGLYVHDGLEALAGVLTIPLGSDAKISLSMSREADREFTASLISLVQNIKRAIEMHEGFSHGMVRPAELIRGSFDGIKVLQEHYGSDDVAEQGARLLLAVLTKMYNLLQASYDGKIVGVIFFNNDVSSDALLNVVINSRPSARWLEEEKGPSSAADVEKLLVRRTLAWLTGLILLISTLLGIYFLLNMPLTKDTLLYSNVKLD